MGIHGQLTYVSAYHMGISYAYAPLMIHRRKLVYAKHMSDSDKRGFILTVSILTACRNVSFLVVQEPLNITPSEATITLTLVV